MRALTALLLCGLSTAALAQDASTDAALAELPGMSGGASVNDAAYEAGAEPVVRPRPTSGNRQIDRQARRQAAGDYDQAPATKPAGLYQEAWNAPLRNKGLNQRQPGYVRYDYAFENVYPVMVREGMITTIRFPADETITRAYPGNSEAFETDAPAANIVALRARYPGVDTSLTAYGASGRVYNFYVRAVGVNAKFTTDFMVDIVGAATQVGGFAPGSPAGLGQIAGGARAGGQIANTPDGGPAEDYLDRLPFRPWEVVNDLEVYVPKGQIAGPLPRAVFRDSIFTYIDYGDNARQIVDWPAASLVVQGVETPVNFRTAGPGGRMIVVEAIGDIVLRNGQRVVAIKHKGKRELPQLARRPAVKQPAAPNYVQQSSTLPGPVPAAPQQALTTVAAPAAPAFPQGPAYRLDLGSGEATAMPALFSTIKGESPDVLGRLEARAVAQGGETRLKSSPVASLEEGMRICQALSSRGRTCAVEQVP